MLSVDSPGDLDICFATLLKQQTAHVQITTEVTPFRPYEDFAGTCAERSRNSLDTTHIESVRNDGLYYFIRSRVEYLGNHGNAKISEIQLYSPSRKETLLDTTKRLRHTKPFHSVFQCITVISIY